jgi:hypothetical protein
MVLPLLLPSRMHFAAFSQQQTPQLQTAIKQSHHPSSFPKQQLSAHKSNDISPQTCTNSM